MGVAIAAGGALAARRAEAAITIDSGQLSGRTEAGVSAYRASRTGNSQ